MEAQRPDLPESPCPRCYYANQSGRYADRWTPRPEPGMLTNCLNCGQVLRFGDDMVLVRATRDDLRREDPETRRELEEHQSMGRESYRVRHGRR